MRLAMPLGSGRFGGVVKSWLRYMFLGVADKRPVVGEFAVVAVAEVRDVFVGYFYQRFTRKTRWFIEASPRHGTRSSNCAPSDDPGRAGS